MSKQNLTRVSDVSFEYSVQINIPEIVNRALKTQSIDFSLFKDNLSIISNIYEKNKQKVSRRSRIRRSSTDPVRRTGKDEPSSKTGNQKPQKKNSLHKAFSFSQNSPTPWLSSIHSSVIGKDLSAKLSLLVSTISRTDIEDANESALENYTQKSPLFRRSTANLLARGIPKCLESFGLGLTIKRKAPLRINESTDFLVKDSNSGFPFFSKKKDPKVIRDTKISLRKLFSLNNHRYSYVKKNGTKICGNTNPRIFFKFLINNISNVENEVSSILYLMPTTVLNRLQLSMEDGLLQAIKVRPVWNVPFIIVVLERMFFGRIIDLALDYSRTSNAPIYATGLSAREISDRIIRRIFLLYKSGYISRKSYCSTVTKLYSLDFSKYDLTINLFFLDLLFAIVEQTLVLSTREKTVFNLLRAYVKYTPIVFKGNLYFKRIGIASGNYITNFYDTFVNMLIIFTAMFIEDSKKLIGDYKAYMSNKFSILSREFKLSLDGFSSYIRGHPFSVCGDDCFIMCTYSFILLHRRLCADLGMKVGIKNVFEGFKDYEDDTHECKPFYLGRYWDCNFKPWQTFEYMISHILFRTRFYKDWPGNVQSEIELELSRLLSITLGFVNGKSFLNIYYKDWKPYVDFVKYNRSFTLLKDWPFSEKPTVVQGADFTTIYEASMI